MIDSVSFEHYGADATGDQRDDLIGLYEAVWLSGAKNDDPFFSRERFVDRLGKHLAAPGFELVTARRGGQLLGYMYGFSRTGEDRFAVCELMVAAPFRRQGLGRRLHDELLTGRRERTAELLVEKGNQPARAAYRSWGWHQAGDLRPFADAPNFDVMVIRLPPAGSERA
jgi:ribosomal protein S18 acetylase RimI-like enzyme